MGAGYGPKRMSLAALHFSSRCPAQKGNSRLLLRRLTRPESRTNTPDQIALINRLSKVTDDSIVQGANPDVVIGVGRHEDRFEEGSKAVNMLTRALGCVLFSAQTRSPAVTTSIGG